MKARLFHLWCIGCAILLVGLLAGFISYIIHRAAPSIDTQLFFGDTPAWSAMTGKMPVWDGLWPACIGTLSVTFLALGLSLFPGIATGIWLAEYPTSRFNRILSLAIDVLAGIPSILMGLFGFTLILFLRQSFAPHANASLLLSALCLAMLILPYLAGTTRTALQSLPHSLRLSAQTLGLSRWQMIRHLLLPRATKGILSGIMLSLGRAAEDTAVIMLTGAVANAGLPNGLFERYEALPFTIFYYSAQYQTQQELNMAFGAALTLLCFTASIFAITGLAYQKSITHHE